MKYTMIRPCAECPFTMEAKQFSTKRLKELVGDGSFPCHKTAEIEEDERSGMDQYVAREKSVHCAGALIFLEKRGQPNQMMRIAERLGLYDHSKLDMSVKVR